MMLAVIQKWGKIQGIPLTQEILNRAELSQGDEVEVSAQLGQVVVKPVAQLQGQRPNDTKLPKEPGQAVEQRPIIATRYEHISFNENNVPMIAGTNIKVVEIVLDKIAYGWSPEEIHFQHPHLTLGQIHAALAYYSDHQQAIDQDIERRLERVDRLQQKSGPSPIKARLKAIASSVQDLSWTSKKSSVQDLSWTSKKSSVQDLSWTSIQSGVQDLSWTSIQSGVQDLSWTSIVSL
jgi:uncharacterized protein (DUF433 family)/antitoxin component of MazEF toxin-antitoxin module